MCVRVCVECIYMYLLRNLVTENVTCSGTEPDSGEGEERVSIMRNNADREITRLSGKPENDLLNPFFIYGGGIYFSVTKIQKEYHVPAAC